MVEAAFAFDHLWRAAVAVAAGEQTVVAVVSFVLFVAAAAAVEEIADH